MGYGPSAQDVREQLVIWYSSLSRTEGLIPDQECISAPCAVQFVQSGVCRRSAQCLTASIKCLVSSQRSLVFSHSERRKRRAAKKLGVLVSWEGKGASQRSEAEPRGKENFLFLFPPWPPFSPSRITRTPSYAGYLVSWGFFSIKRPVLINASRRVASQFFLVSPR